ncbi:MAG: O-acetylhomoserine aminocarboxypropyltransferase/cysteine synthase [Desulfobulbaceae bacterium]|nr:O-acetylhomoserine aminocarboxypropyltransferase/cysteine synthase [Desulfobulbaceae bacterium]
MPWKPETLRLHAGHTTRSQAVVPIYQTSSYVFNDTEDAAQLFSLKPEVWAPRLNLDQDALRPDDFAPEATGNIYPRIMNPTTDVLEKRLMHLEGGVGALATSSGSSAITYAIINICRPDDNIVSSSSLYGGTYKLFLITLPQFGIETTFVDTSNPEKFAAAINEQTKSSLSETIGNPRLDTPDIEKIAIIAHRPGFR